MGGVNVARTSPANFQGVPAGSQGYRPAQAPVQTINGRPQFQSPGIVSHGSACAGGMANYPNVSSSSSGCRPTQPSVQTAGRPAFASSIAHPSTQQVGQAPLRPTVMPAQTVSRPNQTAYVLR